MSDLQQFLIDKAPDFFGQLVTPTLIVSGIWFLFQYVFKLGGIKTQFDSLQASVGDLTKKTSSLVNNVTVIKTHLVDRSGVDANLFQTMSPITLTNTGRKLMTEIGFAKYVEKNSDEIAKTFVESNANTLLKIDEISETLVLDLFEKGEFPSYDNEAFQRGITLEVLLRGCALYLRNHIAKKLNINQ